MHEQLPHVPRDHAEIMAGYAELERTAEVRLAAMRRRITADDEADEYRPGVPEGHSDASVRGIENVTPTDKFYLG
jgi:hypothetical protein